VSDLDADDLALIARLRALPSEGDEPAWDRFGVELARQLDAAPPRPWWRRWWAPAIGLSLAAATSGAVVLWPGPSRTPAPVAVTDHDAAAEPAPPPVPGPTTRPGDAVFALGGEGELDDAELDDEDVVAGMIEALALDAEGDGVIELAVPDEPVEGLVPDLDLDWIDELEDEELDAVTAWLEDEAG